MGRTVVTGALALLSLLVVLAAGPATAAKGERTATGAYVAGTGLTVDCAGALGGNCFDVRPGEIGAGISVYDDAGTGTAPARFEMRDADGAALATGAFCGSTSVPIPAGTTQIAVLVAAADPACDGAGRASMGKITVAFATGSKPPPVFDVGPQDCVQPTPHQLGAAGVTDDGREVTVAVLVLLDGVSEKRGREMLAQAQQSYTPLNIVLAPKFRSVDLDTGGDAANAIGQVRAAVGGSVPKGFDVVHGIFAERLNSSGQADCLGGVRFRDRAFSVSWLVADRPFNAGVDVGPPLTDRAAKTVAHEIGHLLGAQHHYGNTVDGEQPGQATVMFGNFGAAGISWWFSTLNAAAVRGHAITYAD